MPILLPSSLIPPQSTKVILIGGSAGVGKSTVARCVANHFIFAHHIATGYLRESLRTYLLTQQYPELFTPTFRPSHPDQLLTTFCRQAELVCRAVVGCIQRSYTEGTHLILEGNHLLPAYLVDQQISAYVILAAEEHELAERLHGPTHATRTIGLEDFQNIVRTQQFILQQAQLYKIPVVYNCTIEQATADILKLIV